MTVAQIVKHLDGSRPVRFLVAETETGYTLLSALWLARRFGIADKVEISPLFETAEALEQGPRIIDEALRSPHWRAYLRQHGRLCLQFGYSDSGRYIGQLAATFWIERLPAHRRDPGQARAAGRRARHLRHARRIDRARRASRQPRRPPGLSRARPLAPRLRRGRHPGRCETSFQGTDGYLLFGTRALGRGDRRAHRRARLRRAAGDAADPIYDEPDFATEFFGTVRQDMEALVDDPGYAALIGTFGPSLLDKTGSRPAARQSDAGGPASIRHPRELRAIPNNAILQQLGWLANSIHGLGHAASRSPDLFRSMRERSDRFDRAYPPGRARDGGERPRRACAPISTRSTRAAGSTGRAGRRAKAAATSCWRSPTCSSGSTSRRACAGCSGASRPMRCICARRRGRCRACRPRLAAAARAAARDHPPHLVPGDAHPRFPAAERRDARGAAGARHPARRAGCAEAAGGDLPAAARPDARARFRRDADAARGRDLRGAAPRPVRADEPRLRRWCARSRARSSTRSARSAEAAGLSRHPGLFMNVLHRHPGAAKRSPGPRRTVESSCAVGGSGSRARLRRPGAPREGRWTSPRGCAASHPRHRQHRPRRSRSPAPACRRAGQGRRPRHRVSSKRMRPAPSPDRLGEWALAAERGRGRRG